MRSLPRGSHELQYCAVAMTDWPDVSAVLTVLDEEKNVRAAVEALLGQDYPAGVEGVVALGPSRDRTDEIVKSLSADDPRVTWVDNPSGRTPEGLNRAIARTSNAIVARVDGHSKVPKDYLRIAVETMLRTGADNVGGVMSAEGTTPFEHAVARAMTSKFGVGNAPFHVGGEEGPADSVYLGVFRRAAIDRVGGYDERFTRAQDWEMNYRLRQTGGLVWFNPQLRVAYRPRANVRALARQYFHYGRWRCQVMREHPGSVNLRYLAPPLALTAIAAGTVLGLLGLRWHPLLWGWAVPALYVVGVLAASVLTSGGLPARARGCIGLVYPTMHLTWGAGFLSSLMSYTRRGQP